MGRTKKVPSDIACPIEAKLRAGKIIIKGPFHSLEWLRINNPVASQYLLHYLPSLFILGKQKDICEQRAPPVLSVTYIFHFLKAADKQGDSF